MPRKPSHKLSCPENSQSVPTVNHPTDAGERENRLLSAILQASDDAILSKTLDGIITTWNHSAERMFGYTAEEIIGKPKTVLFPPERLQEEEIILDRLKRGITTDHFETVRLHKDGTPLHVSVTISPIKDSNGQVVCASTIARDITERKRAEHEHLLLSAIVEASDDAILSKTLQGVITTWNLAAERIFGWTAKEIIGKPKTVLFPPDRLHEEEVILDRLKHGIPTEHFETVRIRKDGTPIHISVTVSPIKNGDGEVIGASTIARDITERKQAEEQLKEHMAQITTQNGILEALVTMDGLTGLKNHRALQERLQEEYDRARRYNTPLSVLMLDVDKFKQYNDAYGHPAGDAVLRQVARILRETARTCDVVARYGGEEFAVLLPEAGVEEAKIVAERLRHAVETAFWSERAVTVSIGTATVAPTTLHPDALLANADTALYRSKHRGRNCVTHATDVGEAEALDMEATRWYDSLLQRLLAIQSETSGSASEQVRETLLLAYDATILSWSRILDLKDKETEGHSERVTALMVRLMQHLAFNEQEIRFARWGALLHDIGKMAVPDGILHKPGPLTDDEWVIMRQHTTVAYEMLLPIEFLGPAIDISYCHHEKWDGTGYPRGLKGDDIPLMARLFAVIDVYDALTSDRPYRKAWSVEKVRAHLREQAGSHFDPRSVNAFLTMLEEDCALPLAA